MNITEEQKKNLQVFLARVQLSGAEVAAFNDLINALFAKTELPEEKKEEKNLHIVKK